MLITESWATEVRSCPWPQCDTVLQDNYVQSMHAGIIIMIELARYGHACVYMTLSMHVSL